MHVNTYLGLWKLESKWKPQRPLPTKYFWFLTRYLIWQTYKYVLIQSIQSNRCSQSAYIFFFMFHRYGFVSFTRDFQRNRCIPISLLFTWNFFLFLFSHLGLSPVSLSPSENAFKSPAGYGRTFESVTSRDVSSCCAHTNGSRRAGRTHQPDVLSRR